MVDGQLSVRRAAWLHPPAASVVWVMPTRDALLLTTTVLAAMGLLGVAFEAQQGWANEGGADLEPWIVYADGLGLTLYPVAIASVVWLAVRRRSAWRDIAWLIAFWLTVCALVMLEALAPRVTERPLGQVLRSEVSLSEEVSFS